MRIQLTYEEIPKGFSAVTEFSTPDICVSFGSGNTFKDGRAVVVLYFPLLGLHVTAGAVTKNLLEAVPKKEWYLTALQHVLSKISADDFQSWIGEMKRTFTEQGEDNMRKKIVKLLGL